MREHNINIKTNDATANVDKLANSLDKTGKSFDNASNSAEGFAKSTDNIQKVSAGMQGSIQAVSGAMTLLGKDSEAVTEVMGKFSSVMVSTNGLKALGEGIKSSALAQKLFATNTKLATAELKGFKTAMITTGIGALTVAIGVLIDKWDKVENFFKGTKEVSDSTTESIKEQEAAYKLLNDALSTNISLNNLINKNKISGGKSATQVLYEDTEQAQKALEALRKEIEQKFGKSISSLTNEWRFYNDQLLKGTKYEGEKKKYYEEISDALKKYNTQQAVVQELENKQNKTDEQTVEVTQKKIDTLKSKLDTLQDSYKNYGKSEFDILRKQLEDELDLVQKGLDKQLIKSEEAAELNEKIWNKFRTSIKENIKELTEDNALNAVQENLKEQIDIVNQALKDGNVTLEKANGWLTDIKELYEEIEDAKIGKLLSTISTDAFNARKEAEGLTSKAGQDSVDVVNQVQAFNKWLDEGGKKVRNYVDVVGMMGDSFNNLFGSIADNLDENSEEYRAIMITQTILSTLGGIAGAISSAFSPANSEMTIIGQAIAAAVNSAAVLASGIATIAQMKNANENTTPSVPAISTSAVSGLSKPVTSSNLVRGYSEEDLESKVYVVESDITRFQNKKRNLKTNVRF